MGYLLFTNEVTSVNGQVGAVVLGVSSIPGAAPLASPAFTGTPTAPTPATADNSTTLATTAHVQAKIAANAPALAPVQSVAGRTGAVTLAVTDVSGAQAALGFTPINKTGDTGIGNLSMAALTATAGTFSGALSATTGTFSSTVTAPMFQATQWTSGFVAQNTNGNYAIRLQADSTNTSTVLQWTNNANTVGWGILTLTNGNAAFSTSVSTRALSATTGTFSAPVSPGSYTVATLPAGTAGMMAYASNGRKAGEGAGAGTGVLALYTNSAWRDPSQAYAVVVA